MNDRHHVAVTRQPAVALPGWGVFEFLGGEWSAIGSTNHELKRAIDDALEHCSRWWTSTRDLGYVAKAPDLTITQRGFDILSSSPGQLPDDPRKADSIYSLYIHLPLGDPGLPDKWARIQRYPGIDGRMIALGEFNGLSIANAIRDHFDAAELARFEAGGELTQGPRTDLWVRPNWNARALLPEQFPLPPRRTEEQALAFAELVEKANEKKRRTAERKRTQERLAYNNRPLSGGSQ